MKSSSFAFVLAVCPVLSASAASTQNPPPPTQAEVLRSATQAEAQRPQRNVTWRLGDPVKPLNVRWIKGEKPIDFKDGKVHVVEFWATWCGPCRRNMPHMSELAHKYRGKVELISVNVWENKTGSGNGPYEDDVTSFVRHAGEMMDHAVAMDTQDGFMGREWMDASGSGGIPMAFVIDREGKLAWLAPAFEGLEEAIDLALEDKLDAAAVPRTRENYRKAFQLQRDLKSKALAANDPDEAIRLANEAARALPVFANFASWQPLYRAYKMKGAQQLNAFIEQIAEHSRAPVDLQELARAISKDDLASSTRLLEGAVKYSRPYDYVAMELAQAYARGGEYEKALAVQEKAVAGMNGTSVAHFRGMIEAQTKLLDEYREKARGAKKPEA